ncbi:hypothetical protein [Alkalihalobacillus trypoxylicola]|uniref:Uncharacterized protein n=1 Tax=Alkalihalobacillus trypoxylicola TaxID=519424 RepID=A0A162DE96_9BACI|nr:hypothetical protein [Alkalihalobacillus trypoxylicola]KYG29355.1 hypothetical protein AZF04_07465 [Alkalihalobacillus trypoxylicola]GAF64450.1 hypothetical protein BTS2_1343 [Bacillus sp. TS-2]
MDPFVIIVLGIIVPSLFLGGYAVKKDYDHKERLLEVKELELELEMKKLEQNEALELEHQKTLKLTDAGNSLDAREEKTDF